MAMFFGLFCQVLWTTPLAIYFGYRWLARDEPTVAHTCRGSSTCYTGETANMVLTLWWGAIAVICAVVYAVIVMRWRRARAALQGECPHQGSNLGPAD